MTYPIDALPDGGGFTWCGVAGENLEPHKLVYLWANNTLMYACALSENTMPTIALTVGKIPAGSRGKILFIGIISNNDWNWTPSNLLYVSTNAGEITMIPPVESGNQVQVIGMALTETLIIFNPSYILVKVT